MGNKMKAETMVVADNVENLYYQPGLYFGYFI